MAVVRWALVLLMAVLATGAWIHFAGGGAEVASADVQYHCPMHPAVVQGAPGQCPICGMDLVVVEHRREAASTPTAGTTTASAPGESKYWCPMHPEVTSNDPSAVCERCGGMRLMPRPGGGVPASSVPGLAPVEIDNKRSQLSGMRTAEVERRKLGPELRTVGFVAANQASVVVVTARVTGWIEELQVTQSGRRVERGQVLATVSSADLTSAQQAFVNAVRWSDKQNSPYPNAAGPQVDAKRRLELLGVAREEIERIARTGEILTYVPIRAPASGYLARKSALPGLYLQPGVELFQIADLDTIWVIADVFETDVSRVRVGQQARVVLPAYPGQSFAGKVRFVYPALNPETRTLQVRIDLRNPDLLLRPGMFGDVFIEAPAAEALAVPADAVVDTGDMQYVFVVADGGRFEPRMVRVGARADDLVQVLYGVSEHERVVTGAAFLVDSESRLRAAVEAFGAAR